MNPGVTKAINQALQALRNPAADPKSALLVFGLIGVVLLLVLLVVVLVVSIVQDSRRKPVSGGPSGRRPVSPRAKAGRVAFAVTVFALLVVAWNVSVADRTCARCHNTSQAIASHKKDTHAKVSCRDCHVAPGLGGAFTATAHGVVNAASLLPGGPEKTPSTADVSNGACLRCHSAVVDGVTLARGIRMRHSDVLQVGYACTDCHNTAGHGAKVRRARYPQMSQCIVCHDGKKAPSACVTCHSTDVGKASRKPTDVYVKAQVPTDTCRGCHPMKKCIACHGLELPHSQQFVNGFHARKALESPKTCIKCHSVKDKCNNCHDFGVDRNGLPTTPHDSQGAFVTWHPKASGPGMGTCSCHDMDRQRFCNYCHGKQPDH